MPFDFRLPCVCTYLHGQFFATDSVQLQSSKPSKFKFGCKGPSASERFCDLAAARVLDEDRDACCTSSCHKRHAPKASDQSCVHVSRDEFNSFALQRARMQQCNHLLKHACTSCSDRRVDKDKGRAPRLVCGRVLQLAWHQEDNGV